MTATSPCFTTSIGTVSTRTRYGFNAYADLRHNQTNLAGWNLHPRVLLDAIDRPEPEGEARHQEVRLVAGFPVKRHRPARPFLPAQSLDHQSNFVRADSDDRHSDDHNSQEEYDGHDDPDPQDVQGVREHGGPPK
jgi:hypothetical protein